MRFSIVRLHFENSVYRAQSRAAKSNTIFFLLKDEHVTGNRD